MNRTLFALLLAASVVAMAKDPQDKAPAKPAAPAAAPAKAAPAAAIVGNKESKTFHKADCKTAAKMKDANKAEFATAAEATKAGYKACKVCKP
ncbi:MAG: Ada metal-binding domain-containing protein [Holophagaceae bacterium]